MDNITKKMFLTIVLIIIPLFLFFLVYSSTAAQFSSFIGSAEYINFSGQNSEVQFKADVIYFTTNETVFYSLKNITIENDKGERRLINDSSSVQIQHNENFSQYLSNVEVDIYFDNLTMTKNLVYYTDLRGYMNKYTLNQLKPNSGHVIIRRPWVNYVFIKNEKLEDFESISFEMDDSSSVKFFSEVIKLEAYNISDLKIKGRLSKIILYLGEGVLGLDNHIFGIRSPNILDVEIIPNYQNSSYLDVVGTKIVFNGLANSAKINNENMLVKDIFYWLKIQPEKINAYSSATSAIVAVVLVILTAFNVRSTQKLVSMEAEKKKHEKQKFLNILLAELEANSTLIEDSKKSFNRLKQEDVFDFLGFKEDGFNTFRNQGGFQYITSELYTKIVGYYNSLNRISRKISPTFIYLTDEEFNSEIALIENLNNELKSEIEKERGKQ